MKAASAPTSTIDTSTSSPSGRRAAHTETASVSSAAVISEARGTPCLASTEASARGSRPSRAMPNSRRAAAACPVIAANAGPIALVTAITVASHGASAARVMS